MSMSQTTSAPTHASQVSNAAPQRPGALADILRAMRVHQWVKNGLLFVPLVTSHNLGNLAIDVLAIVGFISFSLCVSSVYLLNDLIDRESDRQHPTKRDRPIASGRMSTPRAVLLGFALLVLGLGLGFTWLPLKFVVLVICYLVLSTMYTLALKRVVVVDVLMLAGFYAYRVVLGAAAIEVEVTPWLVVFSIFFFLSLAMAKRYKDLLVTRDQNQIKSAGRGYAVEDLPVVLMLGTVSGYLSVLVLAMYIYESPISKQIYPQRDFLWLLCPCLLYWLTRLWLITNRGAMHDDPVIFALRDWATWAVGAVGAVVMLLAKFG